MDNFLFIDSPHYFVMSISINSKLDFVIDSLYKKFVMGHKD
jgi:hypothetical protein